MKKIIINNSPWQIRIGITWKNRLENIYFSSPTRKIIERAYFKGVITKVLPGIQTAFVDIGQERAGFLHISEIDHELALQNMARDLEYESEETEPEHSGQKKKKDIANIFTEGDSVLVQVSKEPIYEKGAKLTTCFTLPGRFLVLMPNIPRIGVSKKIEDVQERIRLKKIISAHMPKHMGAIIRTTSQDCQEPELLKDLEYLLKEWAKIEKQFARAKPTEKLYEDLPLSMQILRDHLDSSIEAVITNDKKDMQELYAFAKMISPEHAHKISLFTEKTDIFEFYSIQKQIELALDKRTNLKSGGSIIIETTEAMTVIDVNTSKFTGKTNLEDTIFKTNVEAAEEVVRQLKLRNIGGLIVIDFIDMKSTSNKQKLLAVFEKNLKERDKFQSVVLRISEFGLIQMTRKRSGKTLSRQLTTHCKQCSGLGIVKSPQTNCYEILRNVIKEYSDNPPKNPITLELHPDIFSHATSTEFNAILALEKELGCQITLMANKSIALNSYKVS